jgi:glycosyltransferase involved in cell wall biosynthesis
MTERLVFASHRAPVVLDGGAPIRTYKLLTGLSKEFETTLVTFSDDFASPDGFWHQDELSRYFTDTTVVAVNGGIAMAGQAKRRAQLASLTSTQSWVFGRYLIPAFREALRGAVGASGAEIVHFNDFGVALSGPVPDSFNVYAAHNVEHRVQAGMAEAAAGVRKAFAQLESRRVRREEFRLWREMDLCLAVSALDAAAMKTAGVRDVDICLVGTDPVPSFGLRRRHSDEPLRILFVGAGSYQPNEHGIAWFVQNVFPLVRDLIPAVFDVVGPPPNRPIQTRGVTYRGYVPSLDDFYRDADVAIVPIFFGSGTRGKVIEAMAYGSPVISTTLGAEGLQVQPGTHYMRADTAEEFASALVDLAERLRAPDAELARMVQAGRVAAERHFWPNVVSDLVDTYHAKLDARPRPEGAFRVV